MGSNRSKPARDPVRDPECAEKESQLNAQPSPLPPNTFRPKKKKAHDTVSTVNETSTNDKENVVGYRKKNAQTASTTVPDVVKRKEPAHESKQDRSPQTSNCKNDLDCNRNQLKVDKIGERKQSQDDVEMAQDYKLKVKSDISPGAVNEAGRAITNNPDTDTASCHIETHYLECEAKQHPESDSEDLSSKKNNADMAKVTDTDRFRSNISVSENTAYLGPVKHKEIACQCCNRPSESSSSSAVTVSAGCRNDSKNGRQTETTLELPEPYLMQQASAASSLYAFDVSSSSSSLPTNSPVQSSPHTSYPSLFSNVGVLTSSNSSLFRPSTLTQPSASASAFGNFCYSGNMLSSDTTSSFSHSMNNSASLLSTDGFSYGNFSMNSGASVTDTSSSVPNEHLRASITPSNSQFDFSQRYRHSPNIYKSQTGVPAGSSTNSSSGITSNSITRTSNYESPNSSSQTSLSFDSSTLGPLSNITSIYFTNGTNYGSHNWNDFDVEPDSLDLFADETFAQQLSEYLPSYSDGRDTNVFDGDFITIRTSVGDTITKISSKNITLNSNFVGNDLTDENMGIILERPKYPRYATLASREKSFEKVWPVTNKMSWKKLPEAGFVYTGTADCVRCYYCNGGLREWLKNDCPWSEHARYYPHCPHVRQCKGDEFVKRVREGTDDGASAQDAGSRDEMEVDNGADGSTLPRDQEAIRIATEIISDQTLLEKAAYYIKNVQGKSSFDAQELAAIAFEIEDGTIVCDFESTVEDDTISIVGEVLTVSSDNEEEIEIDGLMLEEENRLLRERSLCKVCLDATACVLFLDCGHMIACPMCAPALKTCAVCRAEVKGTVRAIYATDR